MTAQIDKIPVKTITGDNADLADHSGKVRLVVNVASKCGLTPQYEGLEKLYRKYKDKGLVILGFPANDFREQEPGSDAEIQTFCSSTYDVTFPLFSKIKVTGPDKHPLYAALTSAAPKPDNSDEAMRTRLQGFNIPTLDHPELLWNFEKFLIGRDGAVLARFSPDTAPDDQVLVGAIEGALAQ